jgi:CcmD family protein
MMNIKKIFSVLVFLLFSFMGMAQNNNVEMADLMRSNGRIYVVVAVVSTILIGLLLYMFRLDRKLTRLEMEK